jgi:phosphoglucosamine mutase
MVAALALLAVMVRERRKLSELASVFERVPQELVNVRVARKVPLEELPEVQRLIAAVEGRLGADGRVLVRYSGTEMKARVMIEGPDADGIRKDACAIADALVAALAPAGASA